MKVLTVTPVPLSKIKEVLEKRAEAGEELGYEQTNALLHATEFSILDSKKTTALAAKLKKEVPSLTEDATMKLAEIQPTSPELARTILLYSKVDLPDEEIERTLTIIKG